MEQIVEITIFRALKSCIQSLRRCILFIERNVELVEFGSFGAFWFTLRAC